MSDYPVGPEALRDGTSLRALDSAGLFAAVATAGAQVRSIAERLIELGGADRPRALVVLGPTATVDAALLTALCGDGAVAPIVPASNCPPWLTALDVVIALPGRRADESIATAIATAVRRGARVFTRGPVDGPLAHAAGAGLVPVEISVPEAFGAPGRWALLAGIAKATGLLPGLESSALSVIADVLDAAALALTPSGETFLNPAINLAEYLSGAVPVFIGADPVADAVAVHGAAVLAEVAGVAAAVVGSAQAVNSPQLLARAGAARDLFADPYADGVDAVRNAPVLVSVLSGATDGRRGERPGGSSLLGALRRAMPNAMQLDDSAAVSSDVTVAPDETRTPPFADPVALRLSDGPARTLAAAFSVAMTLSAAAVALAVVGARGLPADYPDGLGRGGGTAWAFRPVPEPDRWSGDRDDRDDRDDRGDNGDSASGPADRGLDSWS